jgi:hypothetical protein
MQRLQKLRRDADLSDCGGLLKRIGGIASRVGATDAAETHQTLVRPRDGRHVEIAFAGDAAKWNF